MNKPSKCKNCQWYGKPYWSIINPCDNCDKEEPQIFTRWIDPTINEYKQQITQLTNNWNELEEWLKSNLGNCRTNIKYEIGNEYIIKENVYIKVLDKMKEIKKGRDKE